MEYVVSQIARSSVELNLETMRTMDLSAPLWSQLPFELVEQVLSFVPVPNLCRFRSVCKRWNQLMTSPEFGALCVRNAKQQTPFMILHYTRRANEAFSDQFCFLDLSARQWYNYPDAAYETSLRESRLPQVVAMDGGLVVCTFAATKSRPSTIFKYNPIANTQEELPSAPDHWYRWSSQRRHLRPLLNLAVDNIAQSFKLFLIRASFKTDYLKDPTTTLEERSKILNNPFVSWYNSVTSEWKGSTNPSWIFEGGSNMERQVRPVSSVMFQDLLYVLFEIISYPSDVLRRTFILGPEHRLWRYNLLEDSWQEVYPCKALYPGQLIVSANRFFLVGWSRWFLDDRRNWYSKFQVSEIKLSHCQILLARTSTGLPLPNTHDMSFEKLFTWTVAEAMEVFNIKEDMDALHVHATGFDNSLMFMSYSNPGNLISFDFVTKKWDREWPRNPLGHLPYGQYASWVGKQMNILLPGTPW